MYALWMLDMADLYSTKPLAWESHQNFLTSYSVLYPEMNEFFSKLQEISKTEAQKERHGKVRDYVMDWIEHNQRTSIS
jgi:hypothetical protein